MTPKRRLTIIFLGLLLFLVAPVLLICHVMVQEAVDQDMITSIQGNDAEGVLAALKEGANANARNHYMASRRSAVERFLEIFERIFHPKNRSASNEDPALWIAMRHYRYWYGNPSPYSRMSILKALLDHGADVNIQDQAGRTLLMAAVVSEDKEAVQILLDHHADVHRSSNDGKTALSLADSPSIIQLLKKAGAR